MGVKINNGYGQRFFLNDGGFAGDVIDKEVALHKDSASPYDLTCTDTFCNVKRTQITVDNSGQSADFPHALICEGM